jgi:hypothetical protein
MTTHSLPARPRLGERVSSLAAVIAAPYWLFIAGIYAAYGVLWYFGAKEKLIDQSGTMPAGLAKGFQGTFLASFPGIDAAWLLLGVLEAFAFLLFVASVVAGEFLPQRRKPLLLAAIGVSIASFAAMIFAQSTIGDHASVASLFTYMFGTVVVMAAILALTPARVRQWAAVSTETR